MSRTNKCRVFLYSGAIIIIIILCLSGCGTMNGIASLMQGAGDVLNGAGQDLARASQGYSNTPQPEMRQ